MIAPLLLGAFLSTPVAAFFIVSRKCRGIDRLPAIPSRTDVHGSSRMLERNRRVWGAR